MQFGAQVVRIACGGKTAGAELQHALRHQRAVGQSQQAVADVAHGGHGKGTAQDGGAAAGIKGRDQMNGIVSIAGQLAAEIAQSRAAGEKNKTRPQGRNQAGSGGRRTGRPGFLAVDVHAPPGSDMAGEAAGFLVLWGTRPSSRIRRKIRRPIQASVAA